jgi:hypothetical protein
VRTTLIITGGLFLFLINPLPTLEQTWQSNADTKAFTNIDLKIHNKSLQKHGPQDRPQQKHIPNNPSFSQ